MRNFGLLVVAAFATISSYGAFNCKIVVPAADIGVPRTATVTYSNDGTSAIAAPYVRLEAGDNAFVRFSEADAWSKSVEFLATSEQLPASSLRAGETVEIPVFVYTATQEAQMTLSYTQSSTDAFPWSSIGSSLKPSYVSNSAWTFALVTLKSRFGTTWNSYLSRLRANADYLAENGRPVRRLDNLLQIEINYALGVDAALPVLASVTDAARSARGMGLSFTRSYSSAMYGRFTSGIMGYGWTDNLSTCAELSSDSKTLVFRVPGGGSYSFTKATGAWKPEDARDKTVLTESSSAYTLTYQSGTVQTFAKSNMRTSSIVDNCGNALTFTWSGTTLQKIAHTDGQTMTFTYSGGLLSSVVDDCGRQTTYTYSNSLLTKVTASDGLATSYEYRSADSTAAARALKRIIYPDGTTREFSYDTSSGLVSAVSSNGGKETTTISRDGGVVSLTGPDGAETTIKTGVSGEVLETVDALGGISTNAYTEDGLLKSVVSPSGLSGRIEHDALGRVGKSVSAAGTATAFAYEETFGNLKTVTDAKNHAVTYGYDVYGRGTSVTFADGSSSKLEYNDRGDVVKSTNRRGQSVTYAYDAKGRQTKKTWSNGRTFTYAYDSHDNVTKATDSETGAVTMQYDSADRLIKITYPTGRGFTFAYDSYGRLTKRTSLDGAVEQFAYNASGLLATVKDGGGTTYLQNTYDATTGRLSKQVNGNGTSVSYLYDKLGRVVSIEHCDASGKIVESLQYCYDADGRCIRAASLLGEERYSYDKDGQLTAVDYPDGMADSFAYDAVGNRTTANGATYAVNAMNQYTSVSGGASPVTAITYDKDGNLTSLKDAKGTTSYFYDTLNRLVAVTNTAAGIRWSCRYDVFGNRVSVADNGVTTERTYLQGSLPSVAAEYVNGQLKARHIVVGAVRIADVATTPSSSRYYHADLIGSTRLVTDGNGAIVDRRAYKAFGETRVGNDTAATAGYVGTLGVETDSTGLLFMRNRYYSPTLGRFIQMDPIGQNSGDVNFYRYCNNNGLKSVDPDGFEVLETIALMFDVDMTDPNAVPGLLGPSTTVAASIGSSDPVAKMAERGTVALLANKTTSTALGVSYSNLGRKLVEVPASVVNKAGIVKTVVKGSGKAGAVWAWGSSAYNNLYKKFDVRQFLADGVAGMYKGWFQIGYFAGYWATTGGIKIYKWLKPDKTIVVNVADGGSGGGGSGGSGGGSGQIMSESDWLDIATNSNARTATYSLGADIKLTKSKCFISGFKGKFIGNGHKIMVGAGNTVFTSAGGATFTGTFTSDGALVGSASNCSFENCAVIGAFTAGGTKINIGGLANTANSCSFKNCSASGTIISSEWKVGGLVGKAEGCTFTGCTSKATISGTDIVGGIVGWAEDCDFQNCTASGAVLGKGQVGGFVGYSKNCNYSNCQAKGQITGGDSVGGFAGDLRGGNVAKCSATGKVVCDGSLAQTPDDVGGFAGQIIEDAVVENCLASGVIAATAANTVGGFVGHTSDSTIRRCCASSTVTGGGWVGGFAGSIMEGKTYNCCATGAVAAKGNLSVAYAGGFASMANSSAGADCRYCYASGKATASGGDQMMTIAGGFVPLSVPDSMVAAMGPYISMLMSDSVACYWNTTSTGCKYSSMGTGLTAANAKKQASFSGWDFNTVWKMGTNGPELRNVGATVAEANYMPKTASVVTAVNDDSVSVAPLLASVPLKSVVSAPPRLYSYERYVVVNGAQYSFALSADDGATISVSGLPSGFSLAKGEIKGSAASVSESLVTITAGVTRKTVPFVVIAAPENFVPAGFVLVAFDANEGVSDETTRCVEKNKPVGTLPTPVRAGYQFNGWYTAPEGGTKITATTKVTGDVSYYAHWTAKSYTLTVDPNGGALQGRINFPEVAGTTRPGEVQVVYGTTRYWALGGTLREGYVLDGYYTRVDGGERVFDGNGESVPSICWDSSRRWIYDGVMTVYAHWRLIGTIKIVLHKNDGTGMEHVFTGENDKDCILPGGAKDLKWAPRRGFKFMGWSVDEKSKVVKFKDKENVKAALNAGETLDVYAIWQLDSANAYAIQYIRNDGSGMVRTIGFIGGEARALNSVSALGFARRGYTFGGWAKSTEDARNKKVWLPDKGIVRQPIRNGQLLRVYAIWTLTPGYYSIRFNKNDGTGKWRELGYEYGKNTRLPTCGNGLGWTREGYEFVGWATSKANADAGTIWRGDAGVTKTPITAGKTLSLYAVWRAVVSTAAAADSAACDVGLPVRVPAQTAESPVACGASTYPVVDDAGVCGTLAVEAGGCSTLTFVDGLTYDAEPLGNGVWWCAELSLGIRLDASARTATLFE